MEQKNCHVCGKKALGKNEIGLTRKLLDTDSQRFYCLDCLAAYLEIDTQLLLVMVEEFKEQGCSLF
jgi:predicted nucleic-acid-binding Zn-ribbon protein